MTFRKFQAIAAAHRPDVVVHAHKSFGGVPDVAVYFIRQDGTHSKVYSYRGSYGEILGRLGIKTISENDVATARMMLEMAQKSHGKPGLFTKAIRDNTEEIRKYAELLERYFSDEYVRDWE